MYDRTIVITGILLFLVVTFSPLWYNRLTGKAGYVPELEIATKEKQCVEAISYMRAHHMDLLTAWKEAVVRKGMRMFSAPDGKSYTMSLTGTCLDCHANKSRFCDRCHDYTGVKPRCWECHNVPKVAAR